MSDEEGVDTHARLSWRDMLAELANTEARITTAIRDAVAPLRAASDDHEERLRAIETGTLPWANKLAEAADLTHEKHGERLGNLETAVGLSRGREVGVGLTLGIGRQIILVIAATAGIVATVLSILDRIFS